MCPSCGERIGEARSFCTQCGFRVTTQTAEVHQAASVTELLEGRPLTELVEEPMYWQRALELVADLCAAIASIRANDRVSDLEPGQFFIDDNPGGPRRIKVADATVERLRDAGAPRDTAIGTIGTMIERGRRKYGLFDPQPLPYLSPERLMGKPHTAASDVYFLGVVAFQLLVGRLPFPDAKSPSELITSQLKQQPPAPSELVPEIPATVDRLVLGCLQKRHSDRFTDIAALQRAIAELLRA